jgi:hypothetical protein
MLSHRSTVCATHCAYPDIGAYFVPAENFLPAWHSFALHPQLYAALYSQKFVSPTPIQSQAIPKAFSGRDVIGVAETVSGHCFSYLTSPYLYCLGLGENSRLWTTHSSRTPHECLFVTAQNEVPPFPTRLGSRTNP